MFKYTLTCTILFVKWWRSFFVINFQHKRIHNKAFLWISIEKWLQPITKILLGTSITGLHVLLCYCEVSSMMMKMMVMNCFSGMVDQRKAFSLISSWDHCQRSSPSQISDTPQAGFEPAQNLSSGLVEWNCAAVITTTPLHHRLFL